MFPLPTIRKPGLARLSGSCLLFQALDAPVAIWRSGLRYRAAGGLFTPDLVVT